MTIAIVAILNVTIINAMKVGVTIPAAKIILAMVIGNPMTIVKGLMNGEETMMIATHQTGEITRETPIPGERTIVVLIAIETTTIATLPTGEVSRETLIPVE
jgi:hypothetical protein